MTRITEKTRISASMLFLEGLALLTLCITQVFASSARRPAGQSPSQNIVPANIPYVDAHVHIDEHDPAGSVKALIQAMGQLNSTKVFIQTEPYPADNPDRWDVELILSAVKKYPKQLAVLGGGGTLNAMIQESVRSGDAGLGIQRKFKERAEELVREGVSGFGELTTEHFSLAASPVKDYEYAPADHPLLLLLADIAAQHNIPIDLHMEAAPQTIRLPQGLALPPNPPQIQANIAALGRLLDYNPRAKIIWAHAGSDNTGYRTPELCDQLLAAHPNLYMEMKVDPAYPGQNYPLADGRIKPEWLKLLQNHPDRFIIGSDQHYGPDPKASHARAQETVLFLNQLPNKLRAQIGNENAERIYGGAQISK